MKLFARYTLARVLLFAASWAVVWLVASIWLEWSSVTALWTALIALLVSSVASFVLLRGMRERMAAGVQAGSGRVRQRYRESQEREDPPDE